MKRETQDDEAEALFALVFMLAMLVTIAVGLLAWPPGCAPPPRPAPAAKVITRRAVSWPAVSWAASF